MKQKIGRKRKILAAFLLGASLSCGGLKFSSRKREK